MLLQSFLSHPQTQAEVSVLLKELLSTDAVCEGVSEILNETTDRIRNLKIEDHASEIRSHVEETSHCGMKNLGCICYLLSVMQQFFMITPFRQGILQVETENG